MIYVRNEYTAKELGLRFQAQARTRADLFASIAGWIRFLDMHGEPGESHTWAVLS